MYFPIAELSSYQAKWKIRARITSKGQLRTFNRNGNEGKVFHVDLLDDGGEIRASFFNKEADRWFDTLKVGKCFAFSNGNVKVANKQFNTTNNRYELTFDRDSVVEEVEDAADIAAYKFSFVDLRTLASKTLPCTVDLCGIIASFKPSYSFTSRDGKDLVKRELTLVDDTLTSLDLTLWGDRAKQEDRVFEGNPVVAAKGVLVKEWNGGRSGSLMGGGAFVASPVEPEALRLKEWWAHGGSSQKASALSQSGPGAGGSRLSNAKVVDLHLVS